MAMLNNQMVIYIHKYPPKIPQVVELRGSGVHVCGLAECYVESIAEVPKNGGGFRGKNIRHLMILEDL